MMNRALGGLKVRGGGCLEVSRKRRISSESWQSWSRSGGHMSLLRCGARQAGGVVIVMAGDCGGVIAECIAHDVIRTHSGAFHSLRTKVGAKVDGLWPGL